MSGKESRHRFNQSRESYRAVQSGLIAIHRSITVAALIPWFTFTYSNKGDIRVGDTLFPERPVVVRCTRMGCDDVVVGCVSVNAAAGCSPCADDTEVGTGSVALFGNSTTCGIRLSCKRAGCVMVFSCVAIAGAASNLWGARVGIFLCVTCDDPVIGEAAVDSGVDICDEIGVEYNVLFAASLVAASFFEGMGYKTCCVEGEITLDDDVFDDDSFGNDGAMLA